MSAHSSQSTAPPVLKVALPLPLRELFDYLPPANDEAVQAGARVLVPFGPRELVGIVVTVQAPSSVQQEKLLRVKRVLDQGIALLDENLLSLMQWCWQYYKHAPGDVLQAALPPALRKANLA
jgi:primosomal protein N' (replication factor Y) (superfamily II helicase)